MDLHVNDHDHVRIFVGGKLHAEVTLANARKIEDLENEVKRARHLQALNRFLVNAIQEVGDSKYAEGLISGLKNETEEHPMSGVPPIAPNQHPIFLKGWQTGQALLNISHGIPTQKVKAPEWANPWTVAKGNA